MWGWGRGGQGSSSKFSGRAGQEKRKALWTSMRWLQGQCCACAHLPGSEALHSLCSRLLTSFTQKLSVLQYHGQYNELVSAVRAVKHTRDHAWVSISKHPLPSHMPPVPCSLLAVRARAQQQPPQVKQGEEAVLLLRPIPAGLPGVPPHTAVLRLLSAPVRAPMGNSMATTSGGTTATALHQRCSMGASTALSDGDNRKHAQLHIHTPPEYDTLSQ